MPTITQSPAKQTRKDFQRLAELRAEEAATLAKSKRPQGAYYLGGLAVECALKACIAKRIRRHDFPDRGYIDKVHRHDLEDLLRLADLRDQLDGDMKTSPKLAANWGVVSGWSVESRYEVARLGGVDMVEAVSSDPDGVLQWIKQRW